MPYFLTNQHLRQPVTGAESDQPTPTVKIGDFVIIPENAAGYREAHVEMIVDQYNGAGLVTVTYGSRDLPADLRFGRFAGISPKDVGTDISQIWRRRRVNRHYFTTLSDGQCMEVHSSEYEWYLVWSIDHTPDQFIDTVSYWAD